MAGRCNRPGGFAEPKGKVAFADPKWKAGRQTTGLRASDSVVFCLSIVKILPRWDCALSLPAPVSHSFLYQICCDPVTFGLDPGISQSVS